MEVLRLNDGIDNVKKFLSFGFPIFSSLGFGVTRSRPLCSSLALEVFMLFFVEESFDLVALATFFLGGVSLMDCKLLGRCSFLVLSILADLFDQPLLPLAGRRNPNGPSGCDCE